MNDHLETIEKELEDVLIRFLKALAPTTASEELRLAISQLDELEDRIDSLECKTEDLESRLDNASLDI